MAAAHELSATQQSQLANTQASHTSQTQGLQQQLSLQQGKTKAALQQLEGAEQSVAQLHAAQQQQSERVADLEANLAVSEDTVASAKAELASQSNMTAGMATRLRLYVDAINCVLSQCCIQSKPAALLTSLATLHTEWHSSVEIQHVNTVAAHAHMNRPQHTLLT